MAHLACPKCRQILSDQALDDGPCPLCGYDGPVVMATSPKPAWLIATGAVVVIGLATGGWLLIPHAGPANPAPAPVVASRSHPSPGPPQTTSPAPPTAPAPRPVATATPKPVAPVPPPAVAIAPPPKQPRQHREHPGPTIVIDAKEVRAKQSNNPDGTALVLDMNRDDRLKLTGKAGVLRIGTVGGRAILDASGLEAEEILITGDINDHATVTLSAPGGLVTIAGHVEGSSRLTVNAPRGEVEVAASGRLDGHAEVAVTTKDLIVKGKLAGQSRLIVTLTGGGTAAIGPVEEKATVVYK